jgi:hypothetical protein
MGKQINLDVGAQVCNWKHERSKRIDVAVVHELFKNF